MLNKLKYSFISKTVIFILLVVFAFLTLVTLVGTGVCFSEDFYISTEQDVAENFYFETSIRITDEIRNGVYYYEDDGSMHFNSKIIDIEKISSIADFEIIDGNTNKVIFVSENKSLEDTYLHISESNYIGNVKIKLFLKQFKEENIVSFKYNILMGIYENRFFLLVNSVLCFVISVILFSFLIFSAGYKKGNKEVVPTFIEKIPFDIFTLFIGLGVFFTAIFALQLIDNLSDFLYVSLNFEPIFVYLFGIFLLLFLCGTLFVIWSMSLSKRIKLKSTFKSCLTFRIFKWLFKKIKYVIKFIFHLIKNIHFVWKTVLIITVITFLELIILFDGYIEYIVLFWILEKAILIPVTVFISVLLYKLKVGGEHISNGDFNEKIDTEYMFWEFKEHAQNLNNIGNGISVAVEEKLKSERFKTELITNVSHDIKTPLTSVINYVDLIKKEEPENKKIKEYLDVLENQSNRLKKLVEDLVEASKASSGNINVKLSPCDAKIVLEQAVGEYTGKFKSNNLELVMKTPKTPVKILADGRYLWRIFDNLLNNICKYSLPNSRVYLALNINGNVAEFSFKNISKYELDISPDELTERFVRSDKSRSTEGSGLGLSIAKSLTELQNGEFEISTDGDLFKATVKFKTI